MFNPITLLDNQSEPQLLFSYSKTTDVIVLSILIERNGNFKQLYQQILNIDLQPDGEIIPGGLNENNSPVDTLGINFSKVTTEDNIEIYYTSSNTGHNGMFMYSILVQ